MASAAQTTPSTMRLRSGPNGLSSRQVAEIQFGRILAATAEVGQERGYSRIAVAEIVGRARISRKTFYDLFSDREDCLLALFEQTIAEAGLLAREAHARAPSWRDGTRLALARLLQFMDDERGLARLCVVDALAVGDRVRARRAQALAELARVIDRGRVPAASPSREPPDVTAEGIVGAIVSVLHNRLLQRDEQPFTQLLGPLMSIIVLPYLGAGAAKRELGRPTPPVSRGRAARAPAQDPLQGLNMRLTYRTVRVLMTIAEHPGASNREIADGSGIIDQGQISKLLNRLAGLELVANRGQGHEQGAPNAWHLTARGAKVERATRPTLMPRPSLGKVHVA
jgi:AcrR family transcriptional regulator